MFAIGAVLLGALAGPPRSVPGLDPPQSDYVEHCGGCHGIQGTSFPARVPQLRGRAGYFLCTKESRAYLLELPNVAFSSLDDERLAAMMNFVAFDLGSTGADHAAARFTPAEIAEARRHPLSSASLIQVRGRVVRQIGKRCGVRAGLLDYK